MNDLVKEINQRHNPVAYFRDVPVYVRDDVPEGEIWFIQEATTERPRQINKIVNLK